MNSNYIYVGDNLEIMQDASFKNSVGKVDTVYIDPPYNTQNKFSYEDNREHEQWETFMIERLAAAKALMKETGVIFISIDDSEYAYLKVLCDTVFEKRNFLGTFITHQAQRSNAKFINTIHEYILAYAKDKRKAEKFKIKRIYIPEDKEMINSICSEIKKYYQTQGLEAAQKRLNELIKKYCLDRNITWLKNYSGIDTDGNIYFGKDLSTPGFPNSVSIPEIGLELSPLPTRKWSSENKFRELYSQGKLVFKNGRPYEKHLLVDAEDNASSILNYYSRQGTNDLNKLGLRDLFDTPKPVELIKYLIRISTPENGTVLDFFAGSGTTGQAVYELNKDDAANRNFVLIQLDEKMQQDSIAYSTCKSLGIPEIISEALIYRLHIFLQKQGLNDEKLVIERRFAHAK